MEVHLLVYPMLRWAPPLNPGTGRHPVWHRVAAHVMLEQCQRYDQRQQPLPVVLDEAQELQPTADAPAVGVVLAGEVLLEVAHHRDGTGTSQVLEDVHMLGPGRFAYSPSRPGPP